MRSIKFTVPRIWQKPIDHLNDNFICIVDPSKWHLGKNVLKISYPNIPSSIVAVPHSDHLSVPNPSHSCTNFFTDEISMDDGVLHDNYDQVSQVGEREREAILS